MVHFPAMFQYRNQQRGKPCPNLSLQDTSLMEFCRSSTGTCAAPGASESWLPWIIGENDMSSLAFLQWSHGCNMLQDERHVIFLKEIPSMLEFASMETLSEQIIQMSFPATTGWLGKIPAPWTSCDSWATLRDTHAVAACPECQKCFFVPPQKRQKDTTKLPETRQFISSQESLIESKHKWLVTWSPKNVILPSVAAKYRLSWEKLFSELQRGPHWWSTQTWLGGVQPYLTTQKTLHFWWHESTISIYQ